MKISYNWLKWYIEGEPARTTDGVQSGWLPEPEKLADILTFKLCEIESIEKLSDGDTVLDLNILPNRAHDLLSHQGVAREVAGILGLKFKDPTSLYKVPESQSTNLKVEIKTPACRRYMARIVRNVKVGPSPEWVVKYLESIGQRSINNIVDATNIVMFDCGNPCHAFDLKQIKGAHINIQQAKDGEEFPVVGRDKIVAKLKDTDMVIADGEGNTLAIAGVKGGLNSGINDDTTDIVLEVANFDPVSVRKTARRLNLLSDSAKRFENDLSPDHAEYAMRELSATILEMCPDAEFEEIIDQYPNPQKKSEISFSITWVNKYLGTEISETNMIKILRNYGYEVIGENGLYVLSVSYLRLDLTGQHDIAEEVARLYGLDNIVATPFPVPEKLELNETFAKISAVKKKFIDEDFREVITYAFRKKPARTTGVVQSGGGVYEVMRGVGDKDTLRTNLSDGLRESYEMNRLNAPLLGLQEVKIFEIGAVWPKEPSSPEQGFGVSTEEIHIAWADKKGVTEMTLEEYLKNYELQITNYQLEKINSIQQSFVLWSSYPFISRDIAVWVPENITAEEVLNIINKEKGDLCIKGPDLFDEFVRDGKKSYAFRLVFQSYEKTLTEEEINLVVTKIHKSLEEKSFEIR